MSTNWRATRGLLAVLAILPAGGTAFAQPVRFVNANAEGADTGLSWGDAWTDLQVALAGVEGETRIWVAGGRYTPGTFSGAAFRLADDVGLYGGGWDARRMAVKVGHTVALHLLTC